MIYFKLNTSGKMLKLILLLLFRDKNLLTSLTHIIDYNFVEGIRSI